MRHPFALLSCTLLVLAPAATPVASAKAPDSTCRKIAQHAHTARRLELRSEYRLAVARCQNLADPAAKLEHLKIAREALKSGLREAQEQHAARLELCGALGGGPYDPAVDPAQFVAGVTNPFLPLAPGTVWTYVAQTAEGTETAVVEVTSDTKTILGVTCVVVRDVVTRDSVLIEESLGYYAQDVAGNVWSFGESAMLYEGGGLAGVDGSWTAGVGGASPGIVMKAAPAVGDTYRQGLLLAVAEDAATVLSLDATAVVPAGTFTGCVQILDFSPLEPGSADVKHFAPGIGSVLEVDVASGKRLELVSVAPR